MVHSKQQTAIIQYSSIIIAVMICINEGQTAAGLVVMIQYEGENNHQLKEGMVYHDKQ